MARNIMLDIETFGTSKNALILSIGAVEFTEAEIYKPFHIHIDTDSAEEAGLRIDARTVMWWLTQSKAAQDSLVGEQTFPLRECLQALSDAFDWSDATVWCNGADFDFPILENAFKVVKLPVPWKYYNKMDFRTLKKLVPQELYKRLKVEPEIAHNALFDAYAQAETTQKILQRLSWDTSCEAQVKQAA